MSAPADMSAAGQATYSDPLVIARVDASSSVGRGHLERTFALLEALRALGWRAEVVTTTPGDVRARGHAADHDVTACESIAGHSTDLAHLVARATERDARLIVVDGYPLRGDYLRTLHARTRAVVACIDDAHDGYVDYDCDVVVNANLYADRERPRLAPGGEALVGASYALLGREIVAARDIPRTKSGRVLVSLGGSDQSATLALIAEGLADVSDVRLLLGGSSRPAIASGRAGWSSVRSASMAQELLASDLLVTGAGTTVLEACCVGLPMLAVCLVDNQRRVAGAAAARGLAVDLGESSALSAGAVRDGVRALLHDEACRRSMIEKQRETVDGKGAARVAARLDARAREGRGDDG